MLVWLCGWIVPWLMYLVVCALAAVRAFQGRMATTSLLGRLVEQFLGEDKTVAPSNPDEGFEHVEATHVTAPFPSSSKADDSRLQQVLGELVRAAESALGEDLVSVVLFGTAAEGRLRATSDVNVLVVLRKFEVALLDGVRDLVRADRAAVGLSPMFLLESEIQLAPLSFPVKLADIVRRRRVVFGADVLAEVSIPQEAELSHLRQGLFNLLVRLRAGYVERSLREEQLALVIAGAAGAAAAGLRRGAPGALGDPAETSKAALERVALDSSLPGMKEVLSHVSEAREDRMLAPGVAATTMVGLLALTGALLDRARSLPEVAR